ncbi:SIMPL domain-containing protein [Natrialbaceae archaeon AArc-T1-2]|uniref:SIMPL domain-containing protein n=1 Tax=Natrialbaceae archaeon AArc-T1-2 TaxID=3053904 RepID=UPI00255AB335|nr:SIMPL domain-containing protein [Natrialbaceae archaeon AArc-T1-2]WIV65773.1 SIMPL domain-containing protein [Natrialbaceae archaeon AArc-T1-2]
MRRRRLLLASATAAAGAFAGCLGSADEGTPANRDESDSRTIAVDESGTVETEPDLAVVGVAVEATGDDADAVRDELATRSEELEDALLAFGIDDDDITTTRYDISERSRPPRPEPSPDDVETDDGPRYEGVYAFRVEFADVDEVGALIDAAVDGGADDVGRIEFTLSEERRETLREQALEEALADARSEADVIAVELDADVIEAKRVDATGGRFRATYAEADVAADDTADTPETELHPDDVTVSASVTVEYTIA